jgi:hypothetical protein
MTLRSLPYALSEPTSTVNSAEENGVNFCHSPRWEAAVTLNEMKAVLKVSEQEGQGDAVSKTSVESTAQDDDFQEVKTRKMCISNSRPTP